ncbi:hypothetical protein MKEN_01361700 [Mycena kentingensis (nom. inval.)]|nr:hypothetical protein MKEN_01361700 [Mycena kentingensis (nom. inval.)]
MSRRASRQTTSRAPSRGLVLADPTYNVGRLQPHPQNLVPPGVVLFTGECPMADLSFNERKFEARIPNVGFTIRIRDTPYICVLWTDPIAQISGVWNYHYALQGLPEKPILFTELRDAGYLIATSNGVKCFWNDRVPVADGASTLFAARGTFAALVRSSDKAEFLTTSAFPDAPMHIPGRGPIPPEDLPQPLLI